MMIIANIKEIRQSHLVPVKWNSKERWSTQVKLELKFHVKHGIQPAFENDEVGKTNKTNGRVIAKTPGAKFSPDAICLKAKSN